ncbi:F0F1 ATP synthase subunit A [Fonticella tunisiensis]|uniref:ATP synthase subunit a n=1 Tax=Fonticella tunisiensis TaxID=1096341 RepID=A0A4R7KTL3_9CLOT|nr:F0F1 ATP synthase subunit A [Fonticella tunisiensis]TDT62388.1 ATP synthase F0 subcomplex A subunit [Fonticella tunisiensis]
MGEVKTLFEFTIGGLKFGITYSVVAQWIVMIFIMLMVLLIRGRMNDVPRGIQVWVETLVETINSLVRSNMGEKYEKFTPFVGTLMIYLLLLNLFGLTGFRPPTADYSVALGLAIISFVLIHATAIRNNGIKHYLKGYTHPYTAMLPLNIVERLVVPVSLSLRLFGNITAAVILVELIYDGLAYLSGVLHLGIPLLQAVIPIPFHVYFDLFDGAIQMFIFVMLTMIFIKTTSDH